eukprot:CAMPEP_0174386990 /NCGR_PEP_ID=MMETSP0811_2-20130205/127659_1 /TAXON_ID=73025 ORGANISM="Eutreptiella gymnastica-like, Strain CCMP1594" /NCGR_SAMPLE_ID=MMETSP0811_2 /ASSEMBLY_ACC=CAM_ASM_000667 /LENGTH=93 /DNA_ID=CAMNT_0015541873 /DNA_START=267 /DNA_END=548 /DNA_ORIENTATION=-
MNRCFAGPSFMVVALAVLLRSHSAVPAGCDVRLAEPDWPSAPRKPEYLHRGAPVCKQPDAVSLCLFASINNTLAHSRHWTGSQSALDGQFWLY